MRSRASSIVIAFTLTLTIVAADLANAFSGSGSLSGTSRLRARGCGAYRANFSGTLLVGIDGTWIAQVEDGSFAGTSTPIGRSGRKIRLALDAPSTAALGASIAEDISTTCELPAVTVTSSRPKGLTLALDRTLTKAKFIIKYALKGTAGDHSGTATYKLLGRGPWTAR